MIITKEQFEQDILRLSEYVSQKHEFETFINTKVLSLPRIVEVLVYELFINRFDFGSPTNDLYFSYLNVLSYAKELKENGFVTFK